MGRIECRAQGWFRIPVEGFSMINDPTNLMNISLYDKNIDIKFFLNQSVIKRF